MDLGVFMEQRVHRIAGHYLAARDVDDC